MLFEFGFTEADRGNDVSCYTAISSGWFIPDSVWTEHDLLVHTVIFAGGR